MTKKYQKKYTPTPKQNFSELPDEAYVRMDMVCQLNGACTPVTIYRLMSEGKFPKQRKISNNMVA